jgi:hypothetical protein
MQMKHAMRGQAMVETGVFVTFMMFSMCVLWWAAREGATRERAYEALRYGAQITANTNPTKQWSMQTLYDTSADGAKYSMSATNCANFDVSLVQGTATSFHATLSRGSFFSPVSSTASCTTTPLAMEVGLSRDLMMFATRGTITSNIAIEQIPPGLLAYLQPFDNVKTSQTFFSPPDLKALTHCYSGVYAAINASLYDGAKGTGASSPTWNTANVYNSAPEEDALPISGGCSVSDPGSFSPSAPPSVPSAPAQNSTGVDGLGTGASGGSGDQGIGNGQTIQ